MEKKKGSEKNFKKYYPPPPPSCALQYQRSASYASLWSVPLRKVENIKTETWASVADC